MFLQLRIYAKISIFFSTEVGDFSLSFRKNWKVEAEWTTQSTIFAVYAKTWSVKDETHKIVILFFAKLIETTI